MARRGNERTDGTFVRLPGNQLAWLRERAHNEGVTQRQSIQEALGMLMAREGRKADARQRIAEQAAAHEAHLAKRRERARARRTRDAASIE